MKKLDYYLGGFVGFLVGVFGIPTAYNVGIHSQTVLMALPLIGALLFALGIIISHLVARKIHVFRQIGRFVAVGFLNTSIDFGVLNILSLASGVTSGFFVGGVNIPGFVIAVINSYIWNKIWVFEDRENGNLFKDFPKFLLVTLVGLALNSGIVVTVTTYVHPFLEVNMNTWLNIAKVIATFIVLFWNFMGYKFVVFKKKEVLRQETEYTGK